LYSFTNIGCVSSSPSPISIQMYGWMENIDLGTPTATQYAYTTESAPFREEEKGPVEKISTRLVSASKVLGRIPILRPLSTASSMFFGVTRDISAIFGWSKPIVQTMPVRVRPEPYQNAATTIGCDTVHKLTLDPHQELTIDPRVTGGSEDEMSFAHLYRRKSYVANFTWGASSAPYTTIFTCAVHPNIVSYFADVGNSKIYSMPSAMAFSCQPFEFWRGDIVFRFTVICSKFHRGKLAFFYEPNLAQYTIINSALVPTKQYETIIDIQDTQCVDIKVSWNSYRAWLKNVDAANAYGTLASPGSAAYFYDFANGYIGVYPFTKLQSPDNSNVTVLVSVYATDMHYNVLTEAHMPQYRLTTESEPFGPLVSESLKFSDNHRLSAPVSMIDLAPSNASVDHISQFHFGEEPFSFRTLMKRYVTWNRTAITFGGAANTVNPVKLVSPIFPTSNIPYGTSSTPATYYDLFSYLRYAYLGYRGSIRHRIRILTQTTNTITTSTYTTKLNAPSTSQPTVSLAIQTTEFGNLPLVGGTTFGNVNNAVEVEFPCYTNNLFLLPMSETLDDAASGGVMETRFIRGFTHNHDFVGATGVWAVQLDVASGEDFSFLRFQGSPYYTGATVF